MIYRRTERIITELMDNSDNSSLKCSYCEKTGELFCCSKCKTTLYCGQKCQKIDWALGHYEECQSNIGKEVPFVVEDKPLIVIPTPPIKGQDITLPETFDPNDISFKYAMKEVMSEESLLLALKKRNEETLTPLKEGIDRRMKGFKDSYDKSGEINMKHFQNAVWDSMEAYFDKLRDNILDYTNLLRYTNPIKANDTQKFATGIFDKIEKKEHIFRGEGTLSRMLEGKTKNEPDYMNSLIKDFGVEEMIQQSLEGFLVDKEDGTKEFDVERVLTNQIELYFEKLGSGESFELETDTEKIKGMLDDTGTTQLIGNDIDTSKLDNIGYFVGLMGSLSPRELMSYMDQLYSISPKGDNFVSKYVKKARKYVLTYLTGAWRSYIEENEEEYESVLRKRTKEDESLLQPPAKKLKKSKKRERSFNKIGIPIGDDNVDELESLVEFEEESIKAVDLLLQELKDHDPFRYENLLPSIPGDEDVYDVLFKHYKFESEGKQILVNKGVIIEDDDTDVKDMDIKGFEKAADQGEKEDAKGKVEMVDENEKEDVKGKGKMVDEDEEEDDFEKYGVDVTLPYDEFVKGLVLSKEDRRKAIELYDKAVKSLLLGEIFKAESRQDDIRDKMLLDLRIKYPRKYPELRKALRRAMNPKSFVYKVVTAILFFTTTVSVGATIYSLWDSTVFTGNKLDKEIKKTDAAIREIEDGLEELVKSANERVNGKVMGVLYDDNDNEELNVVAESVVITRNRVKKTKIGGMDQSVLNNVVETIDNEQLPFMYNEQTKTISFPMGTSIEEAIKLSENFYDSVNKVQQLLSTLTDDVLKREIMGEYSKQASFFSNLTSYLREVASLTDDVPSATSVLNIVRDDLNALRDAGKNPELLQMNGEAVQASFNNVSKIVKNVISNQTVKPYIRESLQDKCGAFIEAESRGTISDIYASESDSLLYCSSEIVKITKASKAARTLFSDQIMRNTVNALEAIKISSDSIPTQSNILKIRNKIIEHNNDSFEAFRSTGTEFIDRFEVYNKEIESLTVLLSRLRDKYEIIKSQKLELVEQKALKVLETQISAVEESMGLIVDTLEKSKDQIINSKNTLEEAKKMGTEQYYLSSTMDRVIAAFLSRSFGDIDDEKIRINTAFCKELMKALGVSTLFAIWDVISGALTMYSFSAIGKLAAVSALGLGGVGYVVQILTAIPSITGSISTTMLGFQAASIIVIDGFLSFFEFMIDQIIDIVSGFVSKSIDLINVIGERNIEDHLKSDKTKIINIRTKYKLIQTIEEGSIKIYGKIKDLLSNVWGFVSKYLFGSISNLIKNVFGDTDVSTVYGSILKSGVGIKKMLYGSKEDSYSVWSNIITWVSSLTNVLMVSASIYLLLTTGMTPQLYAYIIASFIRVVVSIVSKKGLSYVLGKLLLSFNIYAPFEGYEEIAANYKRQDVVELINKASHEKRLNDRRLISFITSVAPMLLNMVTISSLTYYSLPQLQDDTDVEVEIIDVNNNVNEQITEENKSNLLIGYSGEKSEKCKIYRGEISLLASLFDEISQKYLIDALETKKEYELAPVMFLDLARTTYNFRTHFLKDN